MARLDTISWKKKKRKEKKTAFFCFLNKMSQIDVKGCSKPMSNLPLSAFMWSFYWGPCFSSITCSIKCRSMLTQHTCSPLSNIQHLNETCWMWSSWKCGSRSKCITSGEFPLLTVHCVVIIRHESTKNWSLWTYWHLKNVWLLEI